MVGGGVPAQWVYTRGRVGRNRLFSVFVLRGLSHHDPGVRVVLGN